MIFVKLIEANMSKELTVIAIGPYSPKIVHFLDYDPKFYAGIPTGKLIITTPLKLVCMESIAKFCSLLGTAMSRLGEHTDVSLKGISKAEFKAAGLSDYEITCLRELEEASFKLHLLVDF